MKYLILLLLSAHAAFGAITEYYVTSAGSGTADGSSEANSMSYATFKDYMETGGSFTAAAGDRFNVDADSTYTITASLTCANAGTLTSPIIIRGYKTSVTDGFQGNSPENGPLVTTNMPTFNFNGNYTFTLANYMVVESMQVTAATLGITTGQGTGTTCINCKWTNSATNSSSAALNMGVRSSCINCDISLTGASSGLGALLTGAAGSRVIGCRVSAVSTTAYAFRITGSAYVVDSVFIGGTGVRVNDVSAVPFLYNLTIVGATGDGLSFITGAVGPQMVINCHITDNSDTGIEATDTGNSVISLYNRFRDNTSVSGVGNGNDWNTALAYGVIDDGSTGTTATDYENYGSNDLRLIQTAPGLSAGIPTQKTIGATQRDQVQAAGGGEHSTTFVQ